MECILGRPRAFGRTFFLSLVAIVAFAGAGLAQETKQFRIGTGGIGGTYYPVGQTIAEIIGDPPGSRPCRANSDCGVPGLIASALTSTGSLENVEGVTGGWMEAGFVQSDIAYWAYTGSETFAGRKPNQKIRAIASLYPESIHLVVSRASKINRLADLKNKSVALGDPESGTLVDARLVLAAAGLDEKRDIRALRISPDDAAAKLARGEIDAFFAVAGYPATNVSRATYRKFARVLSIDIGTVQEIISKHKFLSGGIIPAGIYGNSKSIQTVNVSALMVVSADADANLIYQVTKALWREQARNRFATGHSKGLLITLHSALDGIGIPLHPGAARYYREVGILK